MSHKEFFSGISIPRNKELMRIYRDVELVESLGSGIPRILQAYGEDCFQFSENFIRITFPISMQPSNHGSAQATGQGSDQKTEKWPEKVRRIIEIISNDKSTSIAKLEVELKLGHTTLKKILREMQNENIIRRVGPDKGGYWEVVKQI